ncbi:hypothetical protein CCH79_00011204 [Gambusia affinis]|uniref:CARMIL pleckstrin homology domain-containing protein n=1 Tax=Gambusia affinis TaxID=33528 RepID=A0A315USQ0_GAMAF|nr:hypothetical protein CCH79_00011204 [Gambusia affinis]
MSKSQLRSDFSAIAHTRTVARVACTHAPGGRDSAAELITRNGSIRRSVMINPVESPLQRSVTCRAAPPPAAPPALSVSKGTWWPADPHKVTGKQLKNANRFIRVTNVGFCDSVRLLCAHPVSKDAGLGAAESIRKIIDKSSIKFICSIKLDTKNGKTEDRILVLATWRLYFLAPKIPAKTETTFNFLEIRALNSHPDHQVIIDTDKSGYTLRFESREHLNHVVSHINFALSRIFNNSIFAPSICHSDSDLSEGSRKYSPSSETSVETQRACGGFSETYAALCDYNGISCKEEVQWDVDTIYHSQDSREFNLLDFSHLESRSVTEDALHSKVRRSVYTVFIFSRDLAVIVASMAYNTWFTKLYCRDLRIGSEVTEQVLHTVSKSSSLEEITLENAGLKSDFPQKMATALSENPASVIHSVNLAHNSLDNQGVSSLIQQVSRLSKGLRLLNLSKTSLTSKGVVSLSQALCSSDEYSNSLLHLDLSKNPGVLSGEDASNFYLFLSQPNCLVHLDLSATDCSVDSVSRSVRLCSNFLPFCPCPD